MAGLKKRNLIVITVIILVVVIVLSSFVYLNSQKTYSGKLENVSLGRVSTSEAYSLIIVAQDQHFFAANGINLTSNTLMSVSSAINAVSNNAINFVGMGDFNFVTNVALQQKNLSIISTIDKTEAIFLVARRDKGVENPIDLVGKNIGLTLQGGAGEFYLGRFLDLQGLNIHNITLVDLPTTQYVQAITNGTVDAVVVTKTFADQIKTQLPNNTVTWSIQSNQLAYSNLVCNSEWALQHPEIVVRFLKSLSQAQDYLINNRESGEAIVEKQLNITISQETWSKNQIALSLDQSLLLSMQDEAQWLISNNLTDATSVPNFLNYVYLDGLEAVNPNAVTIIH